MYETEVCNLVPQNLAAFDIHRNFINMSEDQTENMSTANQ